MYQLKRIAQWMFLVPVLLCHSAAGQNAENQQPAMPIDPGIVAVKTQWYRHSSLVSVAGTASLPAMGDEPLTDRGFPTSTRVPGGSRRHFTYEVTLRNDSDREVKAIHWDHVFLDPASGAEVGRHHFFDDRRSIGKGKTATLQRSSGLPPSGVIDAEALGKDRSTQYGDRIDIKCVLYKGEVYWQAAQATDAECSQVRKKLKPSK